MANTQTDQLDLVSRTTVTGGNIIFPPSVRPDDGFSLQVFSPSGEWLGVVNEHDGRFRARNGDTVLRVNLGPRVYHFNGKLLTADGYERAYTATVVLRVQRPRTFATLYRQGSDPVELARQAMHGHLARWTQRLNHDEIAQENVRYHLERGAGFAESQTGVGVERVDEAIAYASEHHTKLRAIREQDTLDRMQHGIDARKHDEQLVENTKDDQAAREKADADALTKDRITGRSVILAELVEAQRKQLNDWFAQGYSLAELQEQQPQLFASLDQLLSGGGGSGRQALPAAPEGPGAFTFGAPPRSVEPPSQPIDVESFSREHTIGAKHRLARLSDDQWAEAYAQVSFHLVYELVELETDGPAERAGLRVGDRILLVAGQPLSDERPLERSLRILPAGATASITYMRDLLIQTANVVIE